MKTQATAEMKADAVEEAERLVNEAADAIRCGSPERAVWRLTDAAGLLGRAFGGEGYASETGRGFWLVDCRDSQVADGRVIRAAADGYAKGLAAGQREAAEAERTREDR